MNSKEEAAFSGDANMQAYLGVCYELGNEGYPQDYQKARMWYERAALQGLAGAQYLLGSLYYFGKGVPQDFRDARAWFERAAAQESPRVVRKSGVSGQCPGAISSGRALLFWSGCTSGLPHNQNMARTGSGAGKFGSSGLFGASV